MTKTKLVMIIVIGGGLIAACNGSNDASVSEFALRNTLTASCENNQPKEINNTNFPSDENAAPLNVDSLQPGCESPGS